MNSASGQFQSLELRIAKDRGNISLPMEATNYTMLDKSDDSEPFCSKAGGRPPPPPPHQALSH